DLRRPPGLPAKLRMVKDPRDSDPRRPASAAADRAPAALSAPGRARAGRTARPAAREPENLQLDPGADGRAFATLAAAGPNSAIPHHRPTDAVLADGDFVKLDFGAQVGGYHSDMTRTLVIGQPAAWQRDLYH